MHTLLCALNGTTACKSRTHSTDIHINSTYTRKIIHTHSVSWRENPLLFYNGDSHYFEDTSFVYTLYKYIN